MNSTRNTTVRQLPSRMPGMGPVIISAVSAVAGAALALAAAAAWDAYDTNSNDTLSLPSTASAGGLRMGRGHVDSDPSVSYREFTIATGQPVQGHRAGHVDSDPSVTFGNAVTSEAIQPASREIVRSSKVGTGHVDSDPSVSYVDVQPAPAPSGPSTLRRGHVDSDPSVDYTRTVKSGPIYPASREGVRGHVTVE